MRLLRQWNPRINLVSKSTLDDAWNRHVADSVQVFEASRQASGLWVDMGSGGGFPGLVIAILALERAPALQVKLIESDQRKCAFLRTVAREAGVSVSIKARRIEDEPPSQASVISARALAPLTDLLQFSQRHGSEDHVAIFPKGRSWRDELAVARTRWRFQHEALQSKTDAEAVILRIEEIEHV